MIGLLFSGQGAQKTVLTEDLYENNPHYRQIIDESSSILGMDIASLLFDKNQADKLASTKYSQPAIMTMSYGLYSLLHNYLPQKKFGIGLSLGEYSALACSGYVGLATALQLIKRRGELMQQASDQTKSSMAAVMKVDLAAVEAACQKASKLGIVQVANVNTPDQVVVGGEQEAVAAVADDLTAQGARIVPLQVSGAFHTPVMAPIQKDLEKELHKVEWQQGSFPVFSTTTQEKFTPTMLTANLTKQLVSTTYFAKTLGQHSAGLTAVIEIGPGRTLISFARKIVPGIATYRTDSGSELEKTISALEADK
ncbi:ACP S-malonyltransferase [Lactobacillus sp. ESL0791]|uniref:ACP S-malonyltransferase n=1 Tax=Lactobacillus sp. ESL0791 TaxID=2983234 RepID=UPI0023F81090|nr:ACP S-malonyltransferase [Lactobacillus sp. ESL0791]MDF7639536.1 ACP S-malonyltransferase [Lactobacillus sp. ESL0791]